MINTKYFIGAIFLSLCFMKNSFAMDNGGAYQRFARCSQSCSEQHSKSLDELTDKYYNFPDESVRQLSNDEINQRYGEEQHELINLSEQCVKECFRAAYPHVN